MDFKQILTFDSKGKVDGTYICSKELCNWQRKAVSFQRVGLITVVLDHKEMTASILKVKIARYISVARKVISDWQTK